jgi:hypothetical protein
MGYYISISLLITFGSVILMFILSWLFEDSGTISVPIVFVLLISIVISLLSRIIDLLNKK